MEDDGTGCWNRHESTIDTNPILLDLIIFYVEFIARRKALEMIGLSDQLESAEMLIQAHLDYREARDGLSTFEDD